MPSPSWKTLLIFGMITVFMCAIFCSLFIDENATTEGGVGAVVAGVAVGVAAGAPEAAGAAVAAACAASGPAVGATGSGVEVPQAAAPARPRAIRKQAEMWERRMNRSSIRGAG
ncbi:MAG: hypothetical protein QM820_35580 [Minicystis sp.]